jgi:hypothetical protein
MVRKKLEPFIEVVGKGPQMSQCIKSKEKQVTELLCTKGNLCCLARGQTVQVLLESQGINGTRLCNKFILDEEGCPSL